VERRGEENRRERELGRWILKRGEEKRKRGRVSATQNIIQYRVVAVM
jgi:hypothetical protein